MQMERQKKQETKHSSPKWLQEMIEMLKTFAIVFVITSLVFGFVIGPGNVKGDSMSPTLHDKEFVLLWKLGTEYQTEDIVFLKWQEQEKTFVKRIIGTPGDKVEINHLGQVLLNDKLLEETYIITETHAPYGQAGMQIQLGEDEYFVLGDNRTNSSDSRQYGVVQEEGIQGKVIPIF